VLRLAGWLAATGMLAAQTAPPGFHLPPNFVPLKYTAELTIDPSANSFDGSIAIRVHVKSPAASLWLDAKDLVVKRATVEGRAAEVKPAGTEMIEIPGVGGFSSDFTVQLDYRGRIDDKEVVGAYRRKIGGQWYVYTTFTPVEARRVFPCFDELTDKAPWEISIRAPSGNRAFSNAAEASLEDYPGGLIFHFAPTPPISTELVAFAVGPFDVFDAPAAPGGTRMRVITPQGRSAEGKSAAESAVALLPRLEAYTGIPYVFGKLDHLAMADAGFSAVENPGLIVYLDKQLLIAPGSETPANTRAVRFLEAHEMAHQWFGDLVTQADWNDVWLSEGFATFIADKMMDQEELPRREHLASIVARQRIMRVDSSINPHPVRMEAHNRDETLGIYNRIAYDKGAAVLLMLENWLGEEKFHSGVRAYLADHRFGNASTRDFAQELAGASGIDPSAVMHSFLDGVGIPRVQAQVLCDRALRLVLRQTGASAIPICYRGDGISPTCTELTRSSAEIELKSCPSWVYVNAGGSGYYRTVWDARPLSSLPLEELTPAERVTLVYDLEAHRNASARAVLEKLASDKEPEIAAAAVAAMR
jgi:alanyl aminopeptidase